jgi:hypothetical protein
MSERTITLTSYYNRSPRQMTATCHCEHPARGAWVELLKQLGFRQRVVNGLRVPWEYEAWIEVEDTFDRAEKIAELAGEFLFGTEFEKSFQA